MPTADEFRILAAEGAEHLRRVEPRFAPIIDHFGPCTLSLETDLFSVLVRSVVAQLISTAAAGTITSRLMTSLRGKLNPTRLLALPEETIRAAGISRAKCDTIRSIAVLFQSQKGLSRKLLAADDAAVRATLLPIKGVGPWTVDMLLIFAMGRPDVWPVGDMGVRIAVKDLFGMRVVPDAKRMMKLSAPWEPFRTFAAWYLWRSRTMNSQ